MIKPRHSKRLLLQDLFFPYLLYLIGKQSLKDVGEAGVAKKITTETYLQINQYASYQPYFWGKNYERALYAIFNEIFKLSSESIFSKQVESINGHKLILILHKMAQDVNDSGIELPQFIESIFAQFLEIEAKQKTKFTKKIIDGKEELVEEEMTDDDWAAMKESADKQALKFLAKLRGNGIFKVK